MLSGSSDAAFPRPFFGIFLPMWCHRFRNVGISLFGILSATGTRGSLTMPHPMASMSEKSLIVQWNSTPSLYPDPRRKNGVADRSITRPMPSLLRTVSRPETHTRAASLFFCASVRSSPFRGPSSSSSDGFSR